MANFNQTVSVTLPRSIYLSIWLVVVPFHRDSLLKLLLRAIIIIKEIKNIAARSLTQFQFHWKIHSAVFIKNWINSKIKTKQKTADFFLFFRSDIYLLVFAMGHHRRQTERLVNERETQRQLHFIRFESKIQVIREENIDARSHFVVKWYDFINLSALVCLSPQN